MMNHYETLGISRDASENEIRQAYRRLAMQWHPDRHQTDTAKIEAENKFKIIQEAYRVLGDVHSRSMYDLSTRTGAHQDPFYGFRDFVHPGEDAESRFPPGADVAWKTSVPLKTAMEGGEILYTRKERVSCEECDGDGWFGVRCEECGGTGVAGRSTRRHYSHYCAVCRGDGCLYVECPACNGKKKVSKELSSRIRIPPGVVDGTEIVAARLGKQSRYFGGRPGDLHITVKIKPEGGYKFSGLDITGSLKISFSIALLGGKVEVSLPTGRNLEIEVPPRSNSGKKIRLSGCGLKSRDGQFGDALLSISIVLPKSRKQLNDVQLAAIRSLDD